jgi:hypothetical protein
MCGPGARRRDDPAEDILSLVSVERIDVGVG